MSETIVLEAAPSHDPAQFVLDSHMTGGNLEQLAVTTRKLHPTRAMPSEAEAAGADTATVGVVIEPHVMLTNLTAHPLMLKQLAVQKWAEARHALRLAPGRSKRLRWVSERVKEALRVRCGRWNFDERERERKRERDREDRDERERTERTQIGHREDTECGENRVFGLESVTLI